MKLELRYDNPNPSYHGIENEELQWYFPQGQFDSYQELLDFAITHWDWHAFYRLYIAFADNVCLTKDEAQTLETLNETFEKDLKKIEIEKQNLEKIENYTLVLRMHDRFDLDPDPIGKKCGTYKNYFSLMKSVSEKYMYQLYDGLYITFQDDYVPVQWEIEALKKLNEKFTKDKEQATKF